MYKILVAILALSLNAPAATPAKPAAKTPPPKAAAAQPARNVAQFTPSDEGDIEDEVEEDFSELDRPAPESKPQESTEPNPSADVTPPEPDVPADGQPRKYYAEPERPSASKGEKVFDWSKYPDAKEVPHPFHEKGLIRITKDRDYIYKTAESEQNRAFDFRIGMYNPENLANPDSPGQTFENNYDQTSNPAFLLSYEWQLWQSPVGKWGLQAGGGLFIAQGNGHFVNNNGLTPREIFTFILVPVNVGAVYRMQFSKRQMFVPYGVGGGTIFGFSEIRDDDKGPKFGGAFGAYGGGGLALNLTAFDALSRIRLDLEYGINAIYFTLEYRAIFSFSKYDLSSNFINGGFVMEY